VDHKRNENAIAGIARLNIPAVNKSQRYLETLDKALQKQVDIRRVHSLS